MASCRGPILPILPSSTTISRLSLVPHPTHSERLANDGEDEERSDDARQGAKGALATAGGVADNSSLGSRLPLATTAAHPASEHPPTRPPHDTGCCHALPPRKRF